MYISNIQSKKPSMFISTSLLSLYCLNLYTVLEFYLLKISYRHSDLLILDYIFYNKYDLTLRL